MNAQVALWLLSTFGAMVFFGLGWVSYGMRRPAKQTASEPSLRKPDDPAEQAAREELESLRTQLASRDGSLHVAYRERDALQKEREDLQRELDKSRKPSPSKGPRSGPRSRSGS
jgi:chromosome segregation ATPase